MPKLKANSNFLKQVQVKLVYLKELIERLNEQHTNKLKDKEDFYTKSMGSLLKFNKNAINFIYFIQIINFHENPKILIDF